MREVETVARGHAFGSQLTRRRIERLLRNPAIVRNRLKVESAVSNARRVLDLQNGIGSFDAYVWQFVGGAEPPASTLKTAHFRSGRSFEGLT